MNRFLLSFFLANELLANRERPERDFLEQRGWVPLGKNCTTGLEGWGKIIDGRAVTVDQPEALKIAGWTPPEAQDATKH